MDTKYHTVCTPSGEGKVQTSHREVRARAIPRASKSKRRYRFSLHILSHVFGFLWIAPITALLVLNLKSHVIGASIWCPRGKCNAEAYGVNAIAKASKLDAEDHNVLGALQFAAKALEVWFMVVATALLYDLAMFLAKSSGGLPIGYLFTHLEFGDIRNLGNPLLWTSALPHGNLVPSKPAGTWKLYLFAVLAAYLTLLTNFMGPATAVLILPTLQWVDTGHEPSQAFGSFGASSPPSGDTVLPGCSHTELLARNYSCTSAVYGPSLDNWVTHLMSSTAQAQQDYGAVLVGTTQEGSVEATINVTKTAELIWVPSRQALRALSSDLFDLVYITGGLQDNATMTQQKPPAFNNSLETVLQRQGPSLGYAGNCFQSNLTVKVIADDRQIRCMDGWDRVETANYTKCFRSGTGWSESNGVAKFYLGDASERSNESSVTVYSSDRATYYSDSTDFGSRIQECMQDDARNCDWDDIFTKDLDTDLRNSSINVFVTEYSNPLHTDVPVWCEAVVYSSFPTYSVNTRFSSNPLLLVNMGNLPVETDKNFNKTPIAVDPDWVLAAWSVAENGTVDRSRAAGKEMARLLTAFYDGFTFDDFYTNYDVMGMTFLYLYSMAQSLSLIDYSYSDDHVALEAAAKAKNKSQPVFKTWATMRVWAYGISGRTPKLGVAVAIMGCVCVLLRLVLSISLRIRHEHSTVELFVAALEHHPNQEFDGLDNESKMAKVRYVLQGDEKQR